MTCPRRGFALLLLAPVSADLAAGRNNCKNDGKAADAEADRRRNLGAPMAGERKLGVAAWAKAAADEGSGPSPRAGAPVR